MTEEQALPTGIQYNFKQGPTLINIYVRDFEDPSVVEDDAKTKLELVGNLASQSAEVGALLIATATAAGLLGAKAEPSTRADSGQAPDGRPGPSCEHGAKVYKSGNKRNGGKWEAWDCPADVCDREWVNNNSRGRR